LFLLNYIQNICLEDVITACDVSVLQVRNIAKTVSREKEPARSKKSVALITQEPNFHHEKSRIFTYASAF